MAIGYSSRRYSNRGGRGRDPRYAVVPSGSYAPKGLFVKLKYSSEWLTGLTNQYNFSGNALYDPDLSGAGQQPMGFDEYWSFYNQYRVTASKISLYIVQGVTTEVGGPPSSVTLLPATSTTMGTLTQCEAMPYAKSRTLGNYTGNRDAIQLDHFARTTDVFGGALDKDSTLSAVYYAYPATQWYWIVAFNTADGSTKDLHFKVLITYHVEFWEPRNLAMS